MRHRLLASFRRMWFSASSGRRRYEQENSTLKSSTSMHKINQCRIHCYEIIILAMLRPIWSQNRRKCPTDDTNRKPWVAMFPRVNAQWSFYNALDTSQNITRVLSNYFSIEELPPVSVRLVGMTFVTTKQKRSFLLELETLHKLTQRNNFGFFNQVSTYFRVFCGYIIVSARGDLWNI